MTEREKRRRNSPGYTKSEFARLSGLAPRRVDKMIELGELKIVTLGGVSAIPPGELQRIKALFEADDSDAA